MIDIEKMLRSGKSIDEINQKICDELNAAQRKLDAEQRAKEEAARKEEAERKAKKAREAFKKKHFNEAVAALNAYFTIDKEMSFTQEEITIALQAAIDGLVLGQKFNSAIEINPNPNSLWDVIKEVLK
jgi:Skp family chaperone for outer membrane proteins